MFRGGDDYVFEGGVICGKVPLVRRALEDLDRRWALLGGAVARKLDGRSRNTNVEIGFHRDGSSVDNNGRTELLIDKY